MKNLLLIACCVALAAGCTCSHDPVDLAGAEQSIRDADLALARAVTECDTEGFKSLLAEDTVFYGTSNAISSGADAVAADWAPLLDPERTTTLTWEPHTIRVGAGGELGYSRGSYEVTSTLEDGTTRTGTGEYVTIWRKNAEGVWQAELDIGTPPQPQEGPAPEPAPEESGT